MQLQWDVIVVGAGPAGMSVAMQCAHAGLEVLVLDRQKEAGGQIWKNAYSASSDKAKFLGGEYEHGKQTIQKFMQSNVTFCSQANVWYVDGNSVCLSYEGKSYYLTAKALVIATGGMERPTPVKGWDLPNVMGAGACDLLLKSASLTPEAPVVICGNGPLILQTLAHLCHLNVPIAGLVLTGVMQQNAWKAFINSYKIVGRPLYFINGISYSLQALLKKVPTYFNSTDISISGEKELSFNFTSLGKKRTLVAKSVLVHEGIVSETRITQLADCRHVWDKKNRYWHVDANKWGETSVDKVYVAGDAGGVSGAEAALAKGNLVGLAICAKLGKLTQEERDSKAREFDCKVLRCKMMQDFTDALFTPNPNALIPQDDTVVCRCEELTAKELKEVVLSGCYSPDAVKAQSRSGMGLCQGRMCSSTVANLIAQSHGIPLEQLNPYKARPPLFPLELGELADMSMPNIGL